MSRESVLVTGEWAENHLDADHVVFVETGNEEADYRKGHIPGCVWISWSAFQDDLELGVIGREKFERLLRSKGIGNDDTVVLLSSSANLHGALAHWYFTLYGHRSVKLLDGGRKKWELDGRPLSADAVDRAARTYRAAAPDASVRAMRDEVLAGIGTTHIVDVRTPEEFAGRIFAPGFAGDEFAPGANPHEVAQRAGHVPGAVNLPWEKAVNADDTFKTDEELRALYAGLDTTRPVVTYCWVGARSAHSWFVLRELLDHPDVKNYDGSWAEYGSLVGVPVARGTGG